jgi:hypothetical protein
MTIRKYLALAWAIAIFWMYFGSLINFHQHQIWKKQLNPTFYAFKREKSKTSVSVVKWADNNEGFSIPPVIASELPPQDELLASDPRFFASILPVPPDDLRPPAHDPCPSSLRAPPSC